MLGKDDPAKAEAARARAGRRTSYSRLMQFPIWRMYDREGRCIASVRAFSLKEARNVFRYHGFTGNRVKKVVKRGR